MPKYDNENKYHYASISDFEQAMALPEGIHQIQLPGELILEVLIRGDLGEIARDQKIPLFLNGAVTDREEKEGPFFSGGGIARSLATPFVSIADPVVSNHDSVGLAWYVGVPGSPVVGVMGRVVTKISWFFGRKILAIGGSGGGFAALALASEHPDVTVFVWNPQTMVLDYNADFVKKYLEVAFDEDWSQDDWKARARERLNSAELVHDLTSRPAAQNFLYLQNSTDWHVSKHCAPFIKAHEFSAEGNGKYTNGRNGTIQIADFGRGHAPPSKQLIQDTIALLRQESCSTLDAIEGLRGKGYLSGTDFDIVPADLRNEVEFLDDLRMEFSTEDGKTFYCHVIHPTEKIRPLSYQFHGMRDERKIGASSKGARTYWYWNAKSINRIDCDIWDGFDHYIGTVSRDFNVSDYADNPGASSE